MENLDFNDIKDIITQIYKNVLNLNTGNVADYIPQLAQVNPDLFGISFCSIHGEIFSIGDTEQEFCLQSCSKPLNYCLARSLNNKKGIDVHNYVGYEPSGRAFNSFVLNNDGLPHNPLINAGAIMISSLIQPDEEPSHRFETVKKFYHSLSGGLGNIGFDNSVFLSEKHHADRNTSLAYYMRENKAFNGYPTPNQIGDTLDLYFQCCSVTVNCQICSSIVSTLANNGVNPISNDELINKDIVRDCLSLMYACGMYDFSGQFSFKIGLPAKSGVSGCLLLVIPNIGGICIWSPRLDSMGNSVRGVEFCKQFVELTNHRYHIFDSVINNKNNSAPISDDKTILIQRLITASSQGDLETIKLLETSIDLNDNDYDGRTAIHLAAAEGHYHVVEYLINKNVEVAPKDRWGNTPYHEANKILQNYNELEDSENDTEHNSEKILNYHKICDLIDSRLNVKKKA